MNYKHNGMETAENQKALEEAKEEVEKVWKNAFKVEAWKSIKPDDLYKQIVEAIKKKERNEKFKREDKQEYNWSIRFCNVLVVGFYILGILANNHLYRNLIIVKNIMRIVLMNLSGD